MIFAAAGFGEPLSAKHQEERAETTGATETVESPPGVVGDGALAHQSIGRCPIPVRAALTEPA